MALHNAAGVCETLKNELLQQYFEVLSSETFSIVRERFTMVKLMHSIEACSLLCIKSCWEVIVWWWERFYKYTFFPDRVVVP